MAWAAAHLAKHFPDSASRNRLIGALQTVEVGLPGDPSGEDEPVMPVPKNLNYDAWLGPTPVVYYTEQRVHQQLHRADQVIRRHVKERLVASVQKNGAAVIGVERTDFATVVTQDKERAQLRLVGQRLQLVVDFLPVGDMPRFMTTAAAELQRAFPGVEPSAFGHLGDGNVHFHVRAKDHDPAAITRLAPASTRVSAPASTARSAT